MAAYLIILLIAVYCESVISDNLVSGTDYVPNTIKTMNLSGILQKGSSILQLLPSNLLLDLDNEECEEHLQILLESVKSMKQWALRMFDSWGKLPDSLFNGNVYLLGDLDECIAQNEADGLFSGKFCLPTFSLAPDFNVYEIFTYLNFTNSPTQYMKGNSFTIPVIPVGMCIPSSCTADDLREILSNTLTQLELPFFPVLNENDCSTNEIEGLDMGDWIAIGILSMMSAIIIISTSFDIFSKYSGKWRDLYVSFSVHTNGKKLFNLRSDKCLAALNGIRFISIFWILLGHTYMICLAQSKNIIEASKESLTWKRILIMNAFVGVDTFFVLSGFLLSYTFLNYMKNKKLSDFNILGFYLHRYLRLTPAFAMMILLQATILKHLGSGPLWKSGMDLMAETCRSYWWTNILYIQNYFKATGCVEQSWYLAVDTQLYLISPPILIALWKKPKYTITALIPLVFIGIVTVFCIAYMNEEHFVIVEMIRNINYDTKIFNLDILRQVNLVETYVSTYTRFPSWIVGILLGFVIYKHSEMPIKLSKIAFLCGWILATALTVGSVCFAHPFVQVNYEYNAVESSTYLAVHRVTWSVGVSWIIFACISGHGGIVNQFLSLKLWIPLSRLTYCVFLTHATVLIMRFASLKMSTPLYITDFFFTLAANTVSSLIAALFLSLMFEAPFIAITKFLLQGRKISSTSEMKSHEDENIATNLELRNGD